MAGIHFTDQPFISYKPMPIYLVCFVNTNLKYAQDIHILQSEFDALSAS